MKNQRGNKSRGALRTRKRLMQSGQGKPLFAMGAIRSDETAAAIDQENPKPEESQPPIVITPVKAGDIRGVHVYGENGEPPLSLLSKLVP